MIDLGRLLLQLLVILVAARLAGRAIQFLGQPPVIGEMIAGLALGPSLLGAISPGTLEYLFPADSLIPLSALSQLGVLLFMFVVGLRLDLNLLRDKARAAVATSYASIAAPFVMAVVLATVAARNTRTTRRRAPPVQPLLRRGDERDCVPRPGAPPD